MRETVLKASAIAQHTAADECAGLADPAELAREIPDLDLHHAWDIEPEQAIELARECEAAGLACDPRLKNSEGATVTTHSGVRVHGNSLGFLAGWPAPAIRSAARWWRRRARTCSATTGIGGAQSGGARVGQRDRQARRAARAAAPGRAPAVYPARAGAVCRRNWRAACSDISSAPSAVPASIGAPRFCSMPPDSRYFRRSSTSWSGRTCCRALASSPFDAEGVATRDRDLVSAGVLQGYVLGSYSARKLGLKTTGNAGGIHNLLVTRARAAASSELLRRMDTGLYVTELMGQGVNGVTGDYSRGASGFWVENGAIAYPVHEITIAGNLRDMLQADAWRSAAMSMCRARSDRLDC